MRDARITASRLLFDLREDRGWEAVAEVRVGFDDALDIEQILSSLARTSGRVRCCPHLPLENILNCSDRKGDAEHVADGCAVDE